MKQILLICAVVALVGCGEAGQQETVPIGQSHSEDMRKYEDSKKAHSAAETNSATVNIDNPIVERAIREHLLQVRLGEKAIRKDHLQVHLGEKPKREKLMKPTGELSKADLEMVTALNLSNMQMTSVRGL